MEYDPIKIPEDVDYHAYNVEEDTHVLRVRADRSRYTYQYLTFEVGYDVGSEYNVLQESQRVTLTRRQVRDLAKQLTEWLAAQ